MVVMVDAELLKLLTLDVTHLLQQCGSLRIVYGDRHYILRVTPKGGVQLCAEDSKPALSKN